MFLPDLQSLFTSVNYTTIGSDNGLSPGRRQAIIWTNAGILLIGPWGTNSGETFIKIIIFSLTNLHLKVSSAKLVSILSWPQCVDIKPCCCYSYPVRQPTLLASHETWRRICCSRLVAWTVPDGEWIDGCVHWTGGQTVVLYDGGSPEIWQTLVGDKSTQVQVMTLCYQETSHYLSQCWPRSMLPYGVTRPQYIKSFLSTVTSDILPIHIVFRLFMSEVMYSLSHERSKGSPLTWCTLGL